MKNIFRLHYIIIFQLSLIWAGLINPENGSELTYVHVLFEWEEIPGSTDYELQVSESSNFTNPLSISTAEPSYIEKDFINWQSSYFWRVRANDGDWMSPNQFSTAETSVTFQNDDNPIEILEYNPALASDGITFYGSYHNNYSAAIDMDGNEVWNSGGVNTYVFFGINENNNYLGGKFLPQYNNALIGCEFSLKDGILWSEPINEEILLNESFIQHELIKLPNGNYMGFIPVIEQHPVPTYTNFPGKNSPFSWEDDCGLYIEFNSNFDWKGEKIVEWNSVGEIVWEWDVFNYYNIDDFDYLAGHWETACNSSSAYDWTHFNALTYNESEDALYVSSRHLDRITKIDYTSKNIIWNMGIQWLGDEVIVPDTLFSGQHGLQVLSNGNIVTLDNGILSQYTTAGITSPISRAIEIAISNNSGEYSATTVWSHTLTYDLYGALSGNVQKLENGNYLINTIGNVDGAYSIEVTPNHETAWMCKYNLGDYSTGPLYRAMKIPGLYNNNDNNLEIIDIGLPQSIQIKSLYPNPFNPIINIKYELSVSMTVGFGIYNIKGEKIDRINIGYKQPGFYTVVWNGENYPSGMYFVVSENESQLSMKKMVLLK